MGTDAALPLKTILLFGFILITQTAGPALLAKTDGFRSLPWTAFCLGMYVFSFWAMAEAIRQGLPLSVLIPALAAIIPLLMVFIGIFLYGESASMQKLALLGAACVCVGIASAIK